MKVEFLNKFNKDLDNLTNPNIKVSILKAIESIEISKKLSEISNVKKLKGHKFAYRIKLGDYRLGFYFENQIVELARVVHRKDIYKIFP